MLKLLNFACNAHTVPLFCTFPVKLCIFYVPCLSAWVQQSGMRKELVEGSENLQRLGSYDGKWEFEYLSQGMVSMTCKGPLGTLGLSF